MSILQRVCSHHKHGDVCLLWMVYLLDTMWRNFTKRVWIVN